MCTDLAQFCKNLSRIESDLFSEKKKFSSTFDNIHSVFFSKFKNYSRKFKRNCNFSVLNFFSYVKYFLRYKNLKKWAFSNFACNSKAAAYKNKKNHVFTFHPILNDREVSISLEATRAFTGRFAMENLIYRLMFFFILISVNCTVSYNPRRVRKDTNSRGCQQKKLIFHHKNSFKFSECLIKWTHKISRQPIHYFS